MTSTSNQAPMVIDYRNNLQIKPRTLKLREGDLKLIVEQIVDFESFWVNGYPLKAYFEAQGWMNFFDMLNGPTFSYLVKYFWVKLEVYDGGVAALE